MTLDPIALYGAVVSTALVIYQVVRNRRHLAVRVAADWPEAIPAPLTDQGVALGRMYLRIDVTNTSARPISITRAGFVLHFDDCRYAPLHFVRRRLTRLFPSVRPVGRGCHALMPHTPGGVRRPERLDEHAWWSATRLVDEVSFEVADQPRGPARIAGVYVETVSGAMLYSNVARENRPLLDRLRTFQGAGYFDVESEWPAGGPTVFGEPINPPVEDRAERESY